MSALVEDDRPDVIFADKMLPAFLWKLIQMLFARAQIEAAARTAVGNYAIGSEDVSEREGDVRTRTCVALLTLAVLVGTATPGSAQTFKSTALALEGLPGLQLIDVEGIRPDQISDGLSSTDIEADVEAQLRHAGISLLSQDERSATPAWPLLRIRVQTAKIGLTYAFSVTVEVRQRVQLISGRSTIAPIWTAEGLLRTVEAEHIGGDVRQTVKVMVNDLINNWLLVNPG